MFEQPRREAQNFGPLRLTQLGQYFVNASGESGGVRGLINTNRRRLNAQGFRNTKKQTIAHGLGAIFDFAESDVADADGFRKSNPSHLLRAAKLSQFDSVEFHWK